jgi:hypothetical protein
MKSLLIAVLVGAGLTSFSQDCSSYYFMQSGKTIEMTIYNKKGEPNGKQVIQVTSVTPGSETTAVLNSEMFDKKGKSMAKSTSTIKCASGVMMIDMKMSLPQQQNAQFAKADAKTENFFIEYPSSMKEGDKLKDGNMNMDIDNNGLKQTVSMVTSDRVVEGKESVTTPAGTWDCYKISYHTKLNIKTMGIGAPFNFDGTEWYAPGFGVVKTESKNGGTAITAIK